MTAAQIELLQRLIAADRRYHSRKAAGKLVSNDDRGVEIGWINGVNPRTAQALIDAGLAEAVQIRSNNGGYLFLGRYEAVDPPNRPY